MAAGDTEGSGPMTWLDYVAMGGQSHVFGTDEWVVKIPRWSWLTALGRVLVHPATPVKSLSTLGGLVEPFMLVERAVFCGPRVVRGRALPGTRRPWTARWAVAAPRLDPQGFLDRRVAVAGAGEAAALMESLLETLEGIRARGWHVLDCIMSNFFAGPDGGVRLVDAGLLIPESHLRGPSQQISSRLFVRRMAPDYAEVLGEVARRGVGDAEGQAKLAGVIAALGPRMERWRSGRINVPEPLMRPQLVAVPPPLRDQIYASLRTVPRNLPLTPHPPSGYTPPHHAITSEN